MNLYALLALCATSMSVTLGVAVYLLNRKSDINKLFMLTMLANAYWAFCTFMKTQSDSVATALFWGKVLAFWPILIALMLHFALAFTESDLLRKKLTYVLMYGPALMFSLIDLTTDFITGPPILMPWGYSNSIAYSFYSQLDGVWAAMVGLIVIFIFVFYYRDVSDKTRKNQTKFVTVALAIPILLSIIIDSIFPFSGLDLPILGAISGSISAIFVVYAMLKYELFILNPEIAAENIFSTMPDSVLLISLDAKIVKVNRSLLELTGYSEAELVGKPADEAMKETKLLNQNGIVPLIGKLSQLREIKNYEISFFTKDGKKLTGTVSCSMVSNNRGQDVGASFVFHDLTERKAMEQKLIRAERLASIGELAGILGHDLRNPLSGISGAAYYLRRKHACKLDAEDLAMFESIDKSINYSNKIINDLLDYSGEINVELIDATPKSLIAQSLAAVTLPANVTIVDDTAEAPVVKVDIDKISKSFSKIIKNAFDSMPNGGELHINCVADADFATFAFKDTGHGIAEEIMCNLWTPLKTTKAKGMGFGLAICRRNIEAHGGKIDVETVIDKGTSVTVKLPLNPLPHA